jgi:hypothetical protein
VAKFRTQAPWEFLLSASRNTLQSYELSRLSHAANIKKEITALLHQWLEETTAANPARWLIRSAHKNKNGPEWLRAAQTCNQEFSRIYVRLFSSICSLR